ncbi:MAG: hypothetical protein HQ541_15230 [Mariniphaga sp.]|nr:hypothetical protein [Mariniphaga sp.]
MKAYYRKNSQKRLQEETPIWDAFINHMDSIYFPGASELLDTKLIAFEYESFKQYYA